MMFAVIRRKLASRGGGSSASVFRNSVSPALSTPRVCNPALGDELTSLPRRLGNARNICHLVISGRSTVGLRPTREVVGNLQPLYIQTSRMNFSSDNGDLVDAVVPFMGESISDGTLATFLKQPGDKVNVDEPIAQVETDKVTIDVASPEAGVIQKFIAKEGDTVEPGTKIAVISKSGEGAASVKKTSDEASSQPPASEKKVEEVPKAGAATQAEKPAATTPPPPPPEKPMATTPPPPKTSASEPKLPPKERER